MDDFSQRKYSFKLITRKPVIHQLSSIPSTVVEGESVELPQEG